MTWEYLIGSEKDFEGAPDWCTHIAKEEEFGVLSWEQDSKTKNGNRFQVIGTVALGVYKCATGAKLNIAAQRRKRESKQWGGVGLPPVGCECEALIPYRDEPKRQWRKVKVVHSDEEVSECIVYDSENLSPHWADEFRPLRTKEQIERDDAIKEITGLIEAQPWREWEKIAECIFDAGYRKTK